MEPSSGSPTPAPTATPCDGYFAAALSFFALAAQADDPQTFFSLYQTGESYLQLGQACQRQLGRDSDT